MEPSLFKIKPLKHLIVIEKYFKFLLVKDFKDSNVMSLDRPVPLNIGLIILNVSTGMLVALVFFCFF